MRLYGHRPFVGFLSLGILCAVLSACATEPVSSGPSLRPTVNGSTNAGSPIPTASRSQTATEKLLLAEQVELQEGGDGIFPSCSSETAPPGAFTRNPGVWLKDSFSPDEYPYIVVLCLRGFRPQIPIELVLTTGNFRATTRILPQSGGPESPDADDQYEDEPSTTLFVDGASLKIYAQGYGGQPVEGPPGTFVTGMWKFYPPAAAREAIAASGTVELNAKQGEVDARIRQRIPSATTKFYYRLKNTGDGSDRLVLVGYPEGALVPIGLYRKRRELEVAGASLIDELGVVTIPPSGSESFEIPPNVLSGRPFGQYCLMPPVDVPTSCERVTNWPSYPGPIALGDRGEPVRKWQDILIAAGVMPDRPDNHDGVFGSAMKVAVDRHLERAGYGQDGDGMLDWYEYNLITN